MATLPRRSGWTPSRGSTWCRPSRSWRGSVRWSGSATPTRLIAFAGLAPGISESDQTRRDGRIGGGGTDSHLRHYLIEATVWARRLPR